MYRPRGSPVSPWGANQAPRSQQFGQFHPNTCPPVRVYPTSQAPGRPTSARNAPISRQMLDPDEGSPCPNASAIMAITSGCIMGRFSKFYYYECQLRWCYDDQLDDVIPALLATCKSFGVGVCNESSCNKNLETLDDFVPTSNYFPCLRAWVLQVVACNKSLRPEFGKQTSSPGPIPRAVKEPGFGLDPWQPNPEPLTEVMTLLSWFNGYFGQLSYQAMTPPAPLRLIAQKDVEEIDRYGVERMRGEIDRALERVSVYKICPRRVSVAVSILPGKDLNLSALIPDSDSPVVYPYLDSGEKHENCTTDFCDQEKVNATYIDQLHVCEQGYCDLTSDDMFPKRKLLDAIKRKQLTAWSLDGRTILGGDALRDFSNNKQPFIAISHVWADGTGAGDPAKMHGHVRSCLFDLFCEFAEELGCKGIWWDAISIPQGEDFEEERRASLKIMEKNYSAAKYTVVHDLYLRNIPWIDGESACLAIVLSSWFTRGWTALELAHSDDIYFVFAKSDDPSEGHVLKNLDRDILLPSRVGGTSCQLVTRAIIQAFRKITRGQKNYKGELTYRRFRVNDILISISGRATSWPRDRPRIASMFAEIELPDNDSQEAQALSFPQYCRKILQGRGITPGNLFHMAEAAEGYGWQPASFFDLPIRAGDQSAQIGGLYIPAPAKNSNPWIPRLDRCDVIGSWSFICDPSPDPDLAAFRRVSYSWPEDGEDEEINSAQSRIKKAVTDAIRSTKHHVILVDPSERYPSRGILVKVRKWSSGNMAPSNVEEIFGEGGFRNKNLRQRISFPCEFVGVVRFSSSELPISSLATFVLFGNDDHETNTAMDLDPRISAGCFIKSNVEGLKIRPLFAQKNNNVERWQHEWAERTVWDDEESIPDMLRIPRMRVVKFSAGQTFTDMALPGIDEIQLSSPYGLFVNVLEN